MLGSFRILLGLAVLVMVMGMVSYWLLRGAEPGKSNKGGRIKSDYIYVKGTITDIDKDEDHAVTVKYIVNGMLYHQSRVWDSNPKNLIVGDDIVVRYAKDDPKSVVTELEEEF